MQSAWIGPRTAPVPCHSNAVGIGLRFVAMSLRHPTRTVVALAAAYAVVLQTLLLAISGPVAGTTEFAAVPLCSSPGHSVPARHSGDCPGPCLGCCYGPAAGAAPAPVVAYAPTALQIVAPAAAAPALLFVSTRNANRSRAPPSA